MLRGLVRVGIFFLAITLVFRSFLLIRCYHIWGPLLHDHGLVILNAEVDVDRLDLLAIKFVR